MEANGDGMHRDGDIWVGGVKRVLLMGLQSSVGLMTLMRRDKRKRDEM